MSKCFENVKTELMENLMTKSKELKQMNITLSRMGLLSGLPAADKNKYDGIIQEIVMSVEGLTTITKISEGV